LGGRTSARSPEARSQRDLVEAAMAGDPATFSDLATVAARRLHVVARLILRDEAAADDATQEALVQAWRDLSALREPDRFESWHHRVLVQVWYRQAQRARRCIEIEGQVRPLLGAVAVLALSGIGRLMVAEPGPGSELVSSPASAEVPAAYVGLEPDEVISAFTGEMPIHAFSSGASGEIEFYTDKE
jgi:DNA-directed RNA polymerase specialized sigma24 family protein